ncbi:MAG: hypothetical protein JNM10_18855 [Planctomycetia bacterium]|nr:hypothetical protein [Planctomycetia bacterium]
MTRLARFVEGGFRVETLAEAEGPVRLHLLPDPSAALARGEPVKRNLYRAAARLDVPHLGVLLLKVHRPRGFVDGLRAALRPSRARKEWTASRYLRGAGVPTPAPVLVAERRRGLRLVQAASAARFLGRRETFAPALAAQPPAKARALLARAGRLIRAFHDRGISHGDLHSGNLLVAPGPGDRCGLDVIDLHTVKVGAPVGPRARRAQLAQWLHSLAAVAGPGGRLRLLLAYLGARPDRRVLARAWAGVEAGVAARERRRLRSRGRRCIEESQTFTSDVGPFTGWRRRDTGVEALVAALAAHDRALAVGGPQVLKDGRKSRVTRAGGLVVKEALLSTWSRRLTARLAPDRLRAGYEHAHALTVRGIGTAAPVAFLRGRGRVVTFYEDLGALPRLDHRVRDALRTGAWSPRRKREVLDACADFTARLHRLGVWHGDLKACNWLVEEHGLRVAFRLVDTDRIEFRGEVDRARRMRNLAQLAASIPRVVTRTDRLRWWRRYARGTPFEGREARRAAARDVAALMAEKTVVVDEPIE